MNQESLFQLVRSNAPITSIHNNCSGKHAGMLTTALHMNEDTKNYVSHNHPVQKRIHLNIEKLCDVQLGPKNFGIDGCSIPAPWMPLKKLAEGFSEFAALSRLSENESITCQQLFSSCVENPLYNAGTGQYCPEVMKETGSIRLT